MTWPPKRFIHWLALEVFAAIFPVMLLILYLILDDKATFERSMANPEISFFTVMITAITIADLYDFPQFIKADQRAAFFAILFFSFFLSLFLFFMLFSVNYDAEKFPLFANKLPDGTYLPKFAISLTSAILAILMFITCFRLELKFSRVRRTIKATGV